MMEMFDFSKRLAYGLAAEKDIANIFRLKKYTVIEFQKDINSPNVGGPKIIVNNESFACPDLLIHSYAVTSFVDVKRSSTCRWYRNDQVWNISMNYKQYLGYCRLNDKLKRQKNLKSAFRMAIAWCIDGGIDKASGLESPSGKFFADIDTLERISKRVNKINNKEELVFWNVDNLEDLYTLKLK